MNISCRSRFANVSLILMVFIALGFMLCSQFTLNSHKIRLIPGSLLQRHLDRLPRTIGVNVHNWLSRNILRLKWEDIHCTRDRRNETTSVSSTKLTEKLSKTLGIMDGQSLFDTNIGCLEWLKHFRSQFPNLDLAGFDEDYGAVDYAKRYFNDTARKFVKRLSRARNVSFDYAINFAGLQAMRADKQCSTVKAILKTIKPGGVLYIGHNLERNCRTKICTKCLEVMENIGFTILDKCFWPRTCLKDESDVYIVFEQNFFGSIKGFSACQTGVFIRKKNAIGTGHTNKAPPALKPSDIYYHC